MGLWFANDSWKGGTEFGTHQAFQEVSRLKNRVLPSQAPGLHVDLEIRGAKGITTDEGALRCLCSLGSAETGSILVDGSWLERKIIGHIGIEANGSKR